MKETGIIRRIDDLGRIVIPRELRRSLNIMEGDALEIFVENGSVILRPHSKTLACEISSLKNHLMDILLDYPDWDRVEKAFDTILEVVSEEL